MEQKNLKQIHKEKKLNISYNSLLSRIKRGYSIEEAINTPNLGRGGSIHRKSLYNNKKGNEIYVK